MIGTRQDRFDPRDLARRILVTCGELFKIMIPVLVLIRLAQQAGLIGILGRALSPVMHLLGLPGEMGLVWATAMTTNLYGGMAAFTALVPPQFTTAQATVICMMMAVAHGLPVEVLISRRAGSRARFNLLLRVAAAVIFGWVLHVFYGGLEMLNVPVRIAWTSGADIAPDWPAWSLQQLKMLGKIVLIVTALLSLLELLKRCGLIDLLIRLCSPLLRMLGMDARVAPLAITGMTLGLTYGGALIIDQSRRGELPPRDVFYAVSLLGLCHSVIEDTLLMLAIGAHWSGLLVGRVFLSLATVMVMVRILGRFDSGFFQRWLITPPKDSLEE